MSAYTYDYDEVQFFDNTGAFSESDVIDLLIADASVLDGAIALVDDVTDVPETLEVREVRVDEEDDDTVVFTVRISNLHVTVPKDDGFGKQTIPFPSSFESYKIRTE